MKGTLEDMKQMETSADVTTLSFEEAFRSLQNLVERLEKGNLPLDESVALFERGTQLVRHCTALLDKAELKIRTLTQDFTPQDAGANFADEPEPYDATSFDEA
jgi:exodeoxyribonuclease VII small subunit